MKHYNPIKHWQLLCHRKSFNTANKIVFTILYCEYYSRYDNFTQ